MSLIMNCSQLNGAKQYALIWYDGTVDNGKN